MHPVTLDIIIRAVAHQQGLTRAELRDPMGRDHRTAGARQLVWLLASRLRPDLSLQILGQRVGRKHPAVLQGIQKAEVRFAAGEPGLLSDVAEVLNDLGLTELPAQPNTVTRAKAGLKIQIRATELRLGDLKARLAALEGAQP